MRPLQISSFAIALSLSALTTAANAAPVIQGSYYEDNSANSCPDDAICDASFSRIPAGQNVLITRVSCHVETGLSP